MLDLARRGRSALLVAATGAGKTLAGFLPTICELASQPSDGLHTLYVSPLKALAVDVQRNLIGPIEEVGLPIRVETRTGDTPSDRKARQRVRPPVTPVQGGHQLAAQRLPERMLGHQVRWPRQHQCAHLAAPDGAPGLDHHPRWPVRFAVRLGVPILPG